MSSADGYYFVGFIQAHGLVPDLGRPQLRTEAPDYGGLKMKVLSVPGKRYISGQMGPMYGWPETHPWYGISTDVVFPGILRKEFFNCDVDGAFDKNKAFESAREHLKVVYEKYAEIEFPEGGFTIEENPSDQRFYQLHRNPGEQVRDDTSSRPLKARAGAGDFQPVPENGYGIFCICTNHPELQKLSLCSVDEREIQDSIIPSKLYPGRNMIGKTDEDPPRQLGAEYWKRAVDSTSSVAEETKEHARAIIDKAWSDRTIHIQDLIDVLNALNIKQAWLFDPACRDLDEGTTTRLPEMPLSPAQNSFPDSYLISQSQTMTQSQTTPPGTPSRSPRSRSRSPTGTPQGSPPGSPQSRKQGQSRRPWRLGGGSSRKSSKRVRKTKRRVHKRKSRKRNTRK